MYSPYPGFLYALAVEKMYADCRISILAGKKLLVI